MLNISLHCYTVHEAFPVLGSIPSIILLNEKIYKSKTIETPYAA